MKRVVSILLSLVCVAICVIGVIFLKPSEIQTQKDGYSGILRLWHIDLFEGGKGSRSAFLNRVAGRYEKKNENLYIMVNTYTAQGAAEAFKKGEYPDLLSFSCGVDGVAEVCRKLSFRFGGGEIGQSAYAYPWCGGGYYLFCLEEDFSSVSAETLVLSDGGNNLPWIAAALYGVKGEIGCESSTSAYVHFLNGKYRYMLGTQRDICRFQTRGVSVYSQPLTKYNDLFQYIAVTVREENAVTACENFVKFLLSDEEQQKLPEIGMYPLSQISAQNTLSAFVTQGALGELRAVSQSALKTGDIKILKSYLKALN